MGEFKLINGEKFSVKLGLFLGTGSLKLWCSTESINFILYSLISV